MSQKDILDVLEKKGKLFTRQIIQELQVGDEPKQFIKKVLKQMRKYHELKFICVEWENKLNHTFRYKITDCKNAKWKVTRDIFLYKKYPELRDRVEIRKKPITRACYLYFL